MIQDPLFPEIQEKVPQELINLLNREDGAAQLSLKLPKTFSAADISTPSDRQRALGALRSILPKS